MSAPPRRPDTEVLTPSAPDFIVLDMQDFIARLKEIKRPDKDAQLVAENIALQLENRISFRRAMKYQHCIISF